TSIAVYAQGAMGARAMRVWEGEPEVCSGRATHAELRTGAVRGPSQCESAKREQGPQVQAGTRHLSVCVPHRPTANLPPLHRARWSAEACWHRHTEQRPHAHVRP